MMEAAENVASFSVKNYSELFYELHINTVGRELVHGKELAGIHF